MHLSKYVKKKTSTTSSVARGCSLALHMLMQKPSSHVNKLNLSFVLWCLSMRMGNPDHFIGITTHKILWFSQKCRTEDSQTERTGISWIKLWDTLMCSHWASSTGIKPQTKKHNVCSSRSWDQHQCFACPQPESHHTTEAHYLFQQSSTADSTSHRSCYINLVTTPWHFVTVTHLVWMQP